MKLNLSLCLVFVNVYFHCHGYSTYPRRYHRESDKVSCPENCRCMTLNSRGTRGLLDTWGSQTVSEKTLKYFSDGINDEAARNGRSMVCQGLRELPEPLPMDLSKLTVYGDSSGNGNSKTRSDVTYETRITQLKRSSFRGNMRLKEITMSGNNIGILYPYVFYHLRDLKILNLPNNNIRHMSAAVFHGLFSLHELNLSDNMIRFLPTPIFNYLRDLRSVNLNGNKIRSVQRNMFRSLVKLEKLDLSRNNITDFYDETFDYNTRLTELHLSGNRLWKLRPRWFKNLYNLKSLSLRGNMIKSIETESFVNLFNLQELLLSANMILRINDGAFKNLRKLDVLDVSTNDLTSVPTSCFDDLSSLEELYLGKNKLTIIANGTFNFATNLKQLDLSGNAISKIQRESLHPMKHVQFIDLSKNKLKKITKNFIHGLETLQELNFAHNFIEKIERNAFNVRKGVDASKITKLNLENNRLNAIGARTFEALSMLKSIDLAENNINKIHRNAFRSLKNLRSCNLRDNKLGSVGSDLFISLSKLLELDLSNNKLKSLDEKAFKGLKSLEDLDLEGNLIHEITPQVFRSVPRMTTLDLKGNKMINFNFSTISRMPYLSMVDLSENNLFTFELPKDVKLRLSELSLAKNNLKTVLDELKQVMSSSSLLMIGGNPLSCDCKVKWLREPLLSRQIRVHSTSNIICKTPSRLHGKKLFELSDKALACHVTKDRNSTALQMCEGSNFVKKRWYSPKSVRKALLSQHATIINGKGTPISNGVLVSEDWILTVGTGVKEIIQSTNPDSYRVKIGRTKGYRHIVRVFRHPLASYGVQYNVALLRLSYSDKTIDTSCIMSAKQYKILSSILKQVSVTTRVTGRSKFSKLKPRKGRVNKSCFHKQLICATIKRPKRRMILVNGSPLYIGHNGDYRLAGIASDLASKFDNKYDFIPLWTVTDWVQKVLSEYNSKCKINRRGKDICSDLTLPSVKDMMSKLRQEIH